MLGKKIEKLFHKYLIHVKLNWTFFKNEHYIVVKASNFYVIYYEEICKNLFSIEIFLDDIIHAPITLLMLKSTTIY